MEIVTNFKVDIYSLNDISAPGSDRKYLGSITGYAALDAKALTNLMQFDATKSLVDGVEILSYCFDSFIIYEVTGLLFDGQLFKNALYSAADLKITNAPLRDVTFVSSDDAVHFLIGDATTVDQIGDYNLDFLKQYSARVVKHQTIFEWGASTFWEGYIIGAAAGDSAGLLKKLKAIGFPKDAIRKFRWPHNIAPDLSKWAVTSRNLFLKSYQKKGYTEHATLRGINQYIYLTIKNKELLNFRVEALQNWL